MQLRIETFDNRKGGNAFYKAVTHPLAARAAAALMRRLEAAGPVALYDPLGFAEGFAEFYPVAALNLAGVFVQDIEAVGRKLLGHAARPVTELAASGARTVLVAAFDAGKLVDHIRHLLPARAEIATLDEMRLPAELVTNPRNYLDPLNFATNFAFFRDDGEMRTRLVTANYWSGYGAGEVALWLCLFDESGEAIAEWREALPSGPAGIVLDSSQIRARLGLKPFTGQLFLHAIGAAGHDIVKYALDTFGGKSLSCTHDANSWPAEFYAGLPAPRSDERVVLWMQNSHPLAIPGGSVALNVMGSEEKRAIERAVAPFATVEIDVAELFPELRWPAQLELAAGKWMVRPRYEAVRKGRRRIAHVNVERTDLKPEPRIAELGNLMGKGFLLPAPILPARDWRSILLPTPMARSQAHLPASAILYDASGREAGRRALGNLPRRHETSLEDLAEADLPSGGGHVELVYDFAAGSEADGWLHALFRYERRDGAHAAETSFGAHIFNTVLTWRGEPQSYAGRPPGLSTRLFLRLGEAPLDTFCHLIYPVSASWAESSDTTLVLQDRGGAEIAAERVRIPRSGSLFWRVSEVFAAQAIRRAAGGGYVTVRDTTCRLFGYHGLIGADGAFSLDHMFGY